MTEAEWFACTDPKALIDFARGKVTRVRFREMALRWINLSRERRWADRDRVLQQFTLWLDGKARHPRADDTRNLPLVVSGATFDTNEYEHNLAIDHLVWEDDALAAVGFAGAAIIELQGLMPSTLPFFENLLTTEARKIGIGRQFATEFRDIAGNPFRRVAWQPEWNTETAAALARAIVAERAFDRMPILADALEDAGCDSQQVLQHCRNEAVHVVGCWVLDSVLGREL